MKILSNLSENTKFFGKVELGFRVVQFECTEMEISGIINLAWLGDFFQGTVSWERYI